MPTTQNEALAQDITAGQTSNAAKLVSPARRSKSRFWNGMCFAVVLLATFTPSLLSLIGYAVRSDLHSYILLVPFVSAYLLYVRRDQLPNNYATDVPLTLVFLVVGAVLPVLTQSLDAAGRVFPDNGRIVLLTLSFLCCLAAGGSLFLGRPWMRAAAFPLGFLIFMVPMPDAMADALETASKYASAEVANLLFHLSGTPFLRSGPIFQLPNITIEVAQQCSGIRSSWVLFVTSILAAHLFLKMRWRRFVLIAFVIPLAILRNGFRILVIGLLCVNLGPQMIDSLIHRRGGPFFFLLSMIPFFLVLWLLHKGDARTRQPK